MLVIFFFIVFTDSAAEKEQQSAEKSQQPGEKSTSMKEKHEDKKKKEKSGVKKKHSHSHSHSHKHKKSESGPKKGESGQKKGEFDNKLTRQAIIPPIHNYSINLLSLTNDEMTILNKVMSKDEEVTKLVDKKVR